MMNSTNANQSANILNYYISQKTMKESILNKLEENINEFTDFAPVSFKNPESLGTYF